jgi:hypothetical protein
MSALWVVYIGLALVQCVLVYWLHLPDDLLRTDPDGLFMTGIVAMLGLAIGSPYHFDNFAHQSFTSALLFGLIISSSIVSFELFSYSRLLYCGIILIVSVLSISISLAFKNLPDALLLGASMAPFAVLFLGSIMSSPWLELLTSLYALICIYLYVSHDRNIDLPCSLVSAYCLSSCLIYGLLSSPEALSREYAAPFFRVIGANDAVLKYTLSGLLLIVWLFRSLIRGDRPTTKKSAKFRRDYLP